MAKTQEHAADRLWNLVKNWLNKPPDKLPPTEVRQHLEDFVGSFDGSRNVGFLEVHQGGNLPEWLPDFSEPADENVDSLDFKYLYYTLHTLLLDVMAAGFGGNTDDTNAILWVAGAKLRFGLRGPHRKPPPRSQRGKFRHYREAAGHYTLVVDGPVVELVPYLVAHLLTAPGAATINRCPAPALHEPGKKECFRFVVTRLSTGGRPRVFCSDACRVRTWEEKERKKREATGQNIRRKRQGRKG